MSSTIFIVVSNVGTSSADISWTAGGSETSWNFDMVHQDFPKVLELIFQLSIIRLQHKEVELWF